MQTESTDITVKARRALDVLWQKAHLKGRTWGRKSPENMFSGTNITIAKGDHLISVSEWNGELVIHEFKRVTGTRLGDEARTILREAGLIEERAQEVKA